MPDLSAITVTELIDATTVQSAKGRHFRMQCRGSFALSFCYGGKITYFHRGQEFVSDRDHAVILPKGAAYTLYGNETGFFPLINFQSDALSLDTFFLIPLTNTESYLADFEQLKHLLLFPRLKARAMSIFYDMLHRLSCEGTAANAVLLPALRYLETDFSDAALSNAFLAAQCGISEVYFRQLFKEQFGTTPHQYILELRLRKAKQLLSDSSLSVGQIAETCGFTNPYHFSRAFRQTTQLTPSEYRKTHRLFIL